MQLANRLTAPCTEEGCPDPSSEFFGEARVLIDSAPAAPGPKLGSPETSTVALALFAGAMIGSGLLYFFSDKPARTFARHRAASAFRASLAPVIAGLREGEQQNSAAPFAIAIGAEASRIEAQLDLLAPLIGDSRAQRLSARIEELQRLGKSDAAAAARSLTSARWALGRILLNSLL